MASLLGSPQAVPVKREGSPRTGPKYDQIYRYLRDQIEHNKFATGEYLPAEIQLAGDFGVSIGTLRKALRKLEQDGYIQRRRGCGTQVSFAPRASRESKAVVVLMGSIKRSFFADIYNGIQTEFDGRGYHPILLDANDSYEREGSCIRKYDRLAGGFIIAPLKGSRNRACYEQLLADGVPFVFIDRYLPDLSVDAVVSDNVRGGYLATRCLLELGHRRIATMGVAGGAISLSHRVDGYRKALSEYGLPFDEGLMFRAEKGGFDGAYGLAREVAARHPDVTAVFCLRDDSAWGCMQGLAERGIRIPDEFSVIGYDDNEDICSRLRPALTTVRQPKTEIGKTAARILLDKLEGASRGKPQIVSLPVELVMRESAAAAPRR